MCGNEKAIFGTADNFKTGHPLVEEANALRLKDDFKE
jgi:hypothetical protein